MDTHSYSSDNLDNSRQGLDYYACKATDTITVITGDDSTYYNHSLSDTADNLIPFLLLGQSYFSIAGYKGSNSSCCSSPYQDGEGSEVATSSDFGDSGE